MLCSSHTSILLSLAAISLNILTMQHIREPPSASHIWGLVLEVKESVNMQDLTLFHHTGEELLEFSHGTIVPRKYVELGGNTIFWGPCCIEHMAWCIYKTTSTSRHYSWTEHPGTNSAGTPIRTLYCYGILFIIPQQACPLRVNEYTIVCPWIPEIEVLCA